MLFDLLSTDMYVSYNCLLAHTLGLNAAIYISELVNINRKAIRKNLLSNGFFKIDRSYIEQRTTLKKEEQESLDKSLEEINILSIGDSKDFLKVNMDSLTGLMLEKNKKIVEETSKIVKRGRPSKKDAILKALKAYITTPNNELKEIYYNWIDAVMEKQGWMSKDSVIEGQNVVNNFCGESLESKIKLVKIASIGGLRDMNWAINEYKKNQSSSINNFKAPNINSFNGLSNEVF